jgi:hypothetical protein
VCVCVCVYLSYGNDQRHCNHDRKIIVHTFLCESRLYLLCYALRVHPTAIVSSVCQVVLSRLTRCHCPPDT